MLILQPGGLKMFIHCPPLVREGPLMFTIRPFCNSDLPALFEVWIGHWQAARYQVNVSITAIERAILSRTFFRREGLLVATLNDRVVAWSHHFVDEDASTATIAAFCFAGENGLAACDELLVQTEKRIAQSDVTEIRFGPVRDRTMGYGGLDPIGHGIAVPISDTRTASMLSRNGYQVAGGLQRFAAQTSTYRVRVNRDFLQLRRSTRVDHVGFVPTEDPENVAMSHFDIELYKLVDHVRRAQVAEIEIWLSDVDVQVMDGGRAILSLPDSDLTLEQRYLIGTVIPTLGSRNVYQVETSVDDSSTNLIAQLGELNFKSIEQGRRWVKSLPVG